MREITGTFDMEEALDEYYFKTVLDSTKKYLTQEDYNITKNFFGTEADVQNIIWIYRYKKYYDFTEEEILGHILPYRKRDTACCLQATPHSGTAALRITSATCL